ncbi:MAG: hypothetical protein SCM11_01315 [Bacillota bacterium]|nr:hypothetical protein [Bacillota bacterium]
MEKGFVCIGWGRENITPDKPVRLRGLFRERISEYVQSELMVTILAVETRDAQGNSIDQMIIVSCDMGGVEADVLYDVRAILPEAVNGFDPKKLFINATHTHTAPFTIHQRMSRKPMALVPESIWPVFKEPEIDIMTEVEFRELLISKIICACKSAWNSRAPGKMSRCLGWQVLSHNRRVLYKDGSTLMYGKTDTPEYFGPEGPEDHGMEMLYFWDNKGSLTGVAVNTASPAQVLENHSFVSADYWGEARRELVNRGRGEVFILPLCGAAGDQSPRDFTRRGRGEPDMFNIPGAQELGRRVVDVVLGNERAAAELANGQVCMKHSIAHPMLPIRTVTREERNRAQADVDTLIASVESGQRLQESQLWTLYDQAAIIERYAIQREQSLFQPEIHVVRLGEAAIVTNPFELFTTYGLQIKARAKAEQTLIVQLSCGHSGYLPTAQAVRAGHYSAIVGSGLVGPEGGDYLVNMLVQAINEMFD